MQLLSLPAITGAISESVTPAVRLNAPPRNLGIQGNFVYGSGGTSVDAYVQTSYDNGATWCDIAQFHFTTASARKVFNLNSQTPVTTQATPTDGSLTANTSVDGLLAVLLRCKYKSTGTYGAGTSLSVDVSADQIP